MSEQAIFLDALDQPDPPARAAYLASACAGNPALRARIDALLHAHAQSGDFLDVTLIEQAAAADRSLAFLQPTSTPGALGRLDHYEVLEVLGRGGMGVVLKARDTKLQRVVALKVLARHLAVSPAARQQFVHEAQAAAAIRDDHVVTIYAVHDEAPRPYLAMEYIAGATLEQRLGQGAPLPLDAAVQIGMQIARGLAAAHDQGLVHRDVKPGNILLDADTGRVKITDFGLAQTIGSAAGSVIAGTPTYMSPEQARGAAVDQRSDLFSLGKVLHELCTSRTPTSCGHRPMPAWLCDLLDHLHAADPRARPASARAVADRLAAGLGRLQSRAARRWRRQLVLAGVVGMLAGAGLLVAYHGLGSLSAPAKSVTVPVSLDLHREDIALNLLTLAGGGDPAQAPPELAAVLGDGPYLLPHAGTVNWMDHSPDGKLLAVPLDEDVVLYAAPNGNYLRTLKGPGGRVVYVTFSGDGRLLAATTWYEGGKGAVRVWDLHTDQECYTKAVPDPRVSGATAFSPDGKCLVTEGWQRLHVWHARTGAPMQTVDGQTGGIADLRFSPDGRRLAVADWDGKRVKIFRWDGAKLAELRCLDGHRHQVSAVVYSTDGKYLASGDRQQFILWNAESLDRIGAVETPADQLCFTPDGRTLLATSTNQRPRTVHAFTRWAVDRQQPLPPLSVAVSAVPKLAVHCLSRDGTTLFVGQGGTATCLRAIDTVTGGERYPRQGHGAPVHAVAVSPDGRWIASGDEAGVVKVWDLAARQVVHSMHAHAAVVGGLSFSPDGRLLATGGQDGKVVLWDVQQGTEARAIHGHARASSRIPFDRDGLTLAVGGEGGAVTLWDVASGREDSARPGHVGAVQCVAYGADGTLMASGGEDKTIVLHDLAKGSTQRFAMRGPVNDVAFSPDGRTLAAVGAEPQSFVYLRDLPTGQEFPLPAGADAVRSVAFSPSAALLATAGDGGVCLWGLAPGAAEPARTIGAAAFGGPVRSIAFTPDGRYLVTANANGTIYLLRF